MESARFIGGPEVTGLEEEVARYSQTPHGVAAMTTHYGDYGLLGEAHAAILAWCRANDRLRAGPSWEVYGHWQADPAKLSTEIYYLLQATGVEANH